MSGTTTSPIHTANVSLPELTLAFRTANVSLPELTLAFRELTLAFRPKQSSREFAHNFPDTGERPAAGDMPTTFQGGPFVTNGPQYE
jgi:hypothetical protein